VEFQVIVCVETGVDFQVIVCGKIGVLFQVIVCEQTCGELYVILGD